MFLTTSHIVTLRDFNLRVFVKTSAVGAPRTGEVDLNYQCKRGNVLVFLDPINSTSDKAPATVASKIKQAVVVTPSVLEVQSIEGKISTLDNSDRLILETIFKDKLKDEVTVKTT